MADVKEIRVPDIGDFDAVDVIDVLVSPGDSVAEEDGLITLESEKASMDVPSPLAGTVKEVKVSAGDQVKQGDVIVLLEVEEGAGEAADEGEEPAAEQEAAGSDRAAEAKEAAEEPGSKGEEASKASEQSAEKGSRGERTAASSSSKQDAPEPGSLPEPAPESARKEADLHAQVLVLGSGPGGYTAAFRAADLGREVVLVERHSSLGGVCLNVGCIPSKALLHAAKVIDEAHEMAERGVRFGEPEIELGKLREWKDGVVGKLTGGLSQLAKRRKVTVVQGTGTFASPHT